MKSMKLLLPAALVAALAACNDDERATAAPTGQAFTARVEGVVATPDDRAELAEPVSVRAVVAASSETAEPVPVTF